MIKFSKDKVLLLHKLIAQETGGSIGLRDEALLDSALENAFAGFDGQEFYPTKEEKGARLGYTLISNHLFCGRQWTLSVKPAAGRVIRPHERLFPSDPPIPPTNPPSRHRAPGKGDF